MTPIALPVIDPPAPSAVRDQGLAREGWTRRFVAPAPRVAEHVEMYGSLGIDVRVETVLEDELAPACGGCALALGRYRVIYTRRTP